MEATEFDRRRLTSCHHGIGALVLQQLADFAVGIVCAE
jgi:hypothetical protein